MVKSHWLDTRGIASTKHFSPAVCSNSLAHPKPGWSATKMFQHILMEILGNLSFNSKYMSQYFITNLIKFTAKFKAICPLSVKAFRQQRGDHCFGATPETCTVYTIVC